MAVTRELRLALGLWVWLAGWGLGRAACPAKCRCSDRRVECEGLEGTELRSLAEALPRATLSLALRHGDLRSLGGLCCLPQLQHLDVSDNHLGSALTFAAFPRLTHLSLQRNALKSLRKDEFASFPALRVLRLDGNLVENVDSDSLRLLHLRHLSLAHNRLRYVHQRTFRWTPRLEVLNLTGNSLTGLLDRNFYFLSGLRRLELEDNGLRHFTAESLQPLPNLETLSLGRNNISALPSGAFRSLRSLRSLSLHSNPLRVLDSGAFEDIPRLQTVVLRNSSRLELVLGGAFSGLGALERVDLSGCEALAFVSPAAFRSTPLLSSLLLNASRGSLRSLPGPLVGRAGLAELRLPASLDCACLAALARSQGPRLTNLLGASTLPCTEAGGARGSVALGSWGSEAECSPRLLMSTAAEAGVAPLLGGPFRLFCVQLSPLPTHLTWTLPSGQTLLSSDDPEPSSRRRRESGRRLRFRRTQPRSAVSFRRETEAVDRLVAGPESLRVAFLRASDAGTYRCSDARGTVASLRLEVKAPTYGLWVEAAGSSTLGLRWNETLSEPSAETRHLVKYGLVGEAESAALWVLLPRASVWQSLTLKRLRPLSNYSACLMYQRGNETLYSACVEGATGRPLVGVGGTLNGALLGLLSASVLLCCVVCGARCLHKRFHVWQEAKYRSRMAASLSGQSFLSSHSSAPSARLAFDNHRPGSISSSRSSRPPSARPLAHPLHAKTPRSVSMYRSPEECEMGPL